MASKAIRKRRLDSKRRVAERVLEMMEHEEVPSSSIRVGTKSRWKTLMGVEMQQRVQTSLGGREGTSLGMRSLGARVRFLRGSCSGFSVSMSATQT